MEIIIIDDEKIAVKETKKIIKRIAFITNIRINVKEFTKYNLELLKNIKNKTALLISHDKAELALCDKLLHIKAAPVTALDEVKTGTSVFE